MEPKITINDYQLTEGQAMTMRVAIEVFASELLENGLGDDPTGKGILYGYLKCIDAIRERMFD